MRLNVRDSVSAIRSYTGKTVLIVVWQASVGRQTANSKWSSAMEQARL